MAKQKQEATFVGLDIGSSQVVCVVGLHQPDQATPSIIGVGRARVSGLKRGVVIDVEETVTAITSALEEAERMSGVAIERATINIDGAHLQSLNASGVIAVARADHEIAHEDLTRVESVASNIQLEANREIITVIPKAYHVDDQKNVTDPVGMSGTKLELDAHIITGSTPAMKNLHNAVFRSGIAINSQLETAMAASTSLLSLQQKDLGVVLVHLGAETTGVAIYHAGVIQYSSIIPLGSNHITKDLVFGLRISSDVAEKLKVEHAIASKPKNKTNTKINLEDYGAAGNVYQYDIDTIVSSRLEEILSYVRAEIEKATPDQSQIGAGIIVTGGGANLKGIAEFTSQHCKLPASVGKLSGYSGISEKITDPSYSAVVGLMLEDMVAPHAKAPKNQAFAVISTILDKIKTLIKRLIP